ncbi:hypothetical protein LWI28_027282 [Acer negundo]|uniref:Uncharacterized protein n=1 Tax=Acer negundo TaxID=4023 RepID=A0AAD5IGQ8_ACENE|nr:hypothetical protein LWI28_027282 [Acer negundo]
MFGEEVDGSSRVGEDEDVMSLANFHNNCEEKIEGDTQLKKMVKALSMLNLGLKVYMKEAFLLDSVGYLSVDCLDLAWWTCVLFGLDDFNTFDLLWRSAPLHGGACSVSRLHGGAVLCFDSDTDRRLSDTDEHLHKAINFSLIDIATLT